MKYKISLLTLLLLLVHCGPSNEEIQDQVNQAVEEAAATSTTTTTQPTTTTTTSTTTTTIYDSTCIDYAEALIDIWPDLEEPLEGISGVWTSLGNGTLTYSQGANQLFENNLKWNKSTRKFKTFKPNKENEEFHNKMLDVFQYINDSNEFGIQGLDEIDSDLLERAFSLVTIAFDTLQEAVDLVPNGNIYGLRDNC